MKGATKIVEIIPDNMPEWALNAMDRGQFFKEALEKISTLESAIAKHESDSELLNLYKQALTKSVCLHEGLLPQGHKYSTCMLNGNVVVTQTKELTK